MEMMLQITDKGSPHDYHSMEFSQGSANVGGDTRVNANRNFLSFRRNDESPLGQKRIVNV